MRKETFMNSVHEILTSRQCNVTALEHATINNRGWRDRKHMYKDMAMRQRMLVTAHPLQDDSTGITVKL